MRPSPDVCIRILKVIKKYFWLRKMNQIESIKFYSNFMQRDQHVDIILAAQNRITDKWS